MDLSQAQYDKGIKLGIRAVVNCQLSTVNCQLSIKLVGMRKVASFKSTHRPFQLFDNLQIGALFAFHRINQNGV